MSTFSYNNCEFYFESVGTGTPIVFIHGFTLDHTMWEDQVNFLKDSHKVITYDMRGYGKSTAPTDQYSHHDDLNALLEYLNIPKAIIVGLSLGGEVAIDFALSYPEKVEKLVLVNSSLGGYKSTVNWKLYGDKVGIEGAKQNWLNHEVFNPTRQNTFALEKLKEIIKNYSGWHFINKDPRQKLDPVAKDRLSEIAIPTIIILGEKDLFYFHAIGDFLNQNIGNSKKIVILGAGHMVNIEMVEEFNDLLKQITNS